MVVVNNKYSYWKSQISAAKEEHKDFLRRAKDCNDAYSKSMNYNIFYSNVNVLSASLLTTYPRPDIQRRFLKRLSNDKLKANTYAEIAKVTSGAIEFYEDQADFMNKIKDAVRHSVKNGRGVNWVEYEPIIEQVQSMGEDGSIVTSEEITDRKLNVHSLGYEEFLKSSAEKEDDVWWVARRHLLTKQDLQDRFGYSAAPTELKFGEEKETQQKRGEVWEIWDKSEKRRYFILIGAESQELLEDIEDPYKLEAFFPCGDLSWLNDGKNIIPIPEYLIYKDKADELESLSKKCSDIESQVKYVLLLGNQDKESSEKIANSKNGAVISLATSLPSDEMGKLIDVVPVDAAMALVSHIEGEKDRIKQDIYDITGISDLMRGATDPRETAEAQKIKGLFGSLRFQDRQNTVQNHIRKMFRIMVEIICEHWDEQTLADITCTYLPTAMDKAQVSAVLQQGGQLTKDQQDILSQPTWNDMMEILRSDKMRNYTIDIETSATVFDDAEALTANINNLTQAYLTLAQSAASLQDPNLVKGFIPIMRMNLSNIKIGSAVSMQIEEALESAVKAMEDSQNQPQQPSIEDKKLQAEMQYKQQQMSFDAQEKERDRQYKVQIDMAKIAADKEIAMERARLEVGYLRAKNEEIAIKRLEEQRRRDELEAQIQFKEADILMGRNVSSNISGDVASIE